MPWLAGTKSSEPAEIVTHDLKGGRFEPDPARTAWFEHVTVEEVDFQRAQFGDFNKEKYGGFYARGSLFVRCDFRRAKFDQGMLSHKPQTTFRECRFDGAELWERSQRQTISVGQTRFERCTFDGAKIRGWFSHEADFLDCHFAGKIDRCRFFGRPPAQRGFLDPPRDVNEFRGNDFREADLIWTTFEYGIDIGAQLWPESDAYIRFDRARERLGRIRPRVESWPDEEERKALVVELQLLEELKQDEIFARRHEPDERIPLSLKDKLWELLTDAA